MARPSKVDRDQTPTDRPTTDARCRASRTSRARSSARRLASLATIIAISAIASSSAPQPALALDSQACEREMVRAAQANDIPLNVLYAVGLTETGRKPHLVAVLVGHDGGSETYVASKIKNCENVLPDAPPPGYSN